MIYRLSSRAEADLAEIWVYSAEQWSIEQADGYEEMAGRRIDGRSDLYSLGVTLYELLIKPMKPFG